MPSVTINEIDNTIVQQQPSMYNTTLVMGGSTFGPRNIPTLLTTLSDLSIFGGGIDGNYGYLMAKNILRLGYPVLFTRIASEDEPTAFASIYGDKVMDDSSLTDYTVLDNADWGYKVDTAESRAGTTTITTDSNKNIIIRTELDTAIPSDSTFKTELTVNDEPVVILSSPTVIGRILTWTIPAGISGYSATGINKEFKFTSAFKYQSDTFQPLTYVDFAATKIESPIKVSALYSGEYGEIIGLDFYRTELAKKPKENEDDPEPLPNYQYSLKVYVGNGVVETFKLMQYEGKGYGTAPSLGEQFDIDFTAALKQAVNGNSKYITIEDDTTSSVPIAVFHEHLIEMDHLAKDEHGEATNQYKLYLINLAKDSSAGSYDNETTIKTEMFKWCSDYLNPTPSEHNFLPGLEDKYTYDFRFVTSAGICKDAEASPVAQEIKTDTMEVYDAIRKLCYTRGDAFGVLDIAQDVSLTANELKEYVPVRQYEQTEDSYIGYYCPWCYGPDVNGTYQWLPPSYWFIQALFNNVNSGGQVYNPPAGVKRMKINGITDTSAQIGGVTLDELQSENSYHVRINPIMNLRNYGYVVYGLRTAYALSPPYELSKKSALQQPHVRILANEVKAVIFDTALGLTFDNNNLLTWNSFVSKVDATLSSMKINNALNDYEIIMDDSLQRDDRKIIYGSVKVSVFEAVEDFIIDFQLDPSTVTYGESTVLL